MRLFFVLAATLFTISQAKRDPEQSMKTPQMIEYWGYPVEIVHVTTEDGYILEMHRIPYGKHSPPSENRPVIFMQHGLECESSNWVINMPEQSAGFLFADAGFDVWLGNMRGNTYCLEHVKYKKHQNAFWKWSWDEMAKYDLDAMINGVLNETQQDSLYYLGHSQGTLTMFSKLSQEPAFSQKIKKFFALAPIGSVAYIKGMLAFLANNFGLEMNAWVDVFGAGEFLPNNIIMKMISDFVCGGIEIEKDLCAEFIFLLCGPEDSKQFNKTRLPVYTSHEPAGTSSINILHWLQLSGYGKLTGTQHNSFGFVYKVNGKNNKRKKMVKKGTVTMYDEGKKDNEKKYGQPNPPEYDFTKIQNPIYIYRGTEDWLSDPTDNNKWLMPRINHTVVEDHVLQGYNHLDFIWGLNAATDIYNPIINMLKKELNMD